MKLFKNNFISKMFLLLLSISIIFPSSNSVSAQHAKVQRMSNELRAPVFPIQKDQRLQNEKSIHIKDSSELERYRPARPPRADGQKTLDKLSVGIASNHEYTFDDLNRLSYADLVDVLVTISTDEISDFWTYSQDVVDFYSDRQRLLYLIDEIEYRGSQFTDSDDRGLATLMEVLNKGFLYQWDYPDPDMEYLEDLSFRGEVTPAVLSVMNNRDFTLGTQTQEEVVQHTGYLVSHSTTDIDMFDEGYSVISYFNNRVDNYITDLSKTDAIYALLSGLEYNLYYNYRLGSYNTPNQAPWHGQIDTFFNEVAYILTFNQFADTDHEWLIDNAVFVITEEGQFHSNSNFALNTFEDSLNLYPYYGGIYLALASAVDDLGGNINYAAIVADYEDYYYGNHYYFDNGEIIIKAGDRVSQDDIKRIYWATKEEKAQFHRLYGIDEPVETGNPDDILTAIIYNDRDEYRMNWHLNGVGTDNGGIYIESWGTFFTWDRVVPADSIYELEELFRHEYFHYLQSRYLVPGMWGDTPMYNYDRLVWVEEGGGEFFAGATRTGIDTRSTKIGNIHSNPSDRYTLDEVLHGTYGSWDIYDYSYAFYDFIYNNHMEIFDQVKEYISNEDASGFDRYMDDLSRDSSLEAEYQDHVQALVNDGGRVVLVENDYLDNHSTRSLATISADITGEISLRNVTERTYTSDLFDTYTVEGRYEGGRSTGETNDREQMNNIVNQVLGSLDNQWSGYRTVTAYFVNHSVNASGNYVYDVVFHGLLTGDGSGNTNQRPTAFAESSSTSVDVGENVSFYGDRSSDSDGTIASYAWDFDDGSTSTRQNPTHSFSSAGHYNVTLTVTDNEGATATDTITITVGNTAPPSSGTETEPNNRKSDASAFTDSVSAHLDADAGDHTDWFTFDVASSGDVTFDLTYTSPDFNIEVEDASGVVVARPLRNATANLSAGTYYIIAYTWTGYPPLDYTITVSGGGGGSTNNAPVAVAESSTVTADVGEQITFFGDGSSDSDGTITSYVWDFDDGDTSTSQNTRHTFTAEGTYNVSLTVTDDQGATSTDTITITVGSVTPPDGVILEVSGTLDSQNVEDFHYFTAVGNGATTVILTAGSANDAITWQLYEAATGTRVGWARQNGNIHEYTMDLVPGTEYELSVYTWENFTINYDVVVTE
ncbi:PKD domain-containing protein [Chengkuizengella marina]|uniref:microbial collagenase n=1 Tax=Chengkuizengella marina TaxID=2507566 RepID=A0A6N9Q8N3_9BACL|nr:PKD domain-containing protein [Chengkuizengella marina]NBI30964.1 PKD domain-containing protein [Chengkuizengella marina]